MIAVAPSGERRHGELGEERPLLPP